MLYVFYDQFSVVGIAVLVFFKQKTAYEMRISDWSSDVCSSDLKIMIAVVAICAVGFGAVTGLVTWFAVDAAQRNADTIAREQAARYSETVRAELDKSMDIARTLAQSFQGLKDFGVARDRKSTRLNSSH